MTDERVIGDRGRLPWKIPEEMRLFMKITAGATVIMGRKTFDSVGILKGRKNIVISRALGKVDGADVCNGLMEGIEKARSYKREVFVIGGAEIFAEAIPIADKMYLSYIKKDYPGDAFFPEFDEAEWRVEERRDYREFEQVVYTRR